ncbi:putative ribosomal protein L22/L17 [Rosa chinensis]|uniref:Putative ribosomal protein L22/L17 n=1 Tax=Rosa chinensis TaxID=74649 RepID=A0A2P6QP29_ROSCH|nr:uncharacterized protein LOC112195982 [Rosa chinensis]PRQ35941.1 putative ribosomal protein L22/L17 [Rosa chinensis]
MVGWQRNCIQSLTRHFGKATLVEATSTPQTQQSLLRRPFYHYSQHLGISSSRNLLSDSSSNVPSPNTLNPPPPSLKQVQYVLKGVTQDPNKIDLVGKLVRGMRVEDVLSQLSVTDKQAAKTMYQAIYSARADATYKHGLDPDRLLVAGASIGKGFVGFSKKRLAYHGKGNGIKVRPKHQLAVVLREIAPEEEAEIARQRADNFLYLSKRLRLTKEENKNIPLQLIRKNKGKFSDGEPSGMAS